VTAELGRVLEPGEEKEKC